jgi:hypothetical protein
MRKTGKRWTDQYNFNHDKNRRKIDGTYVVQNAYLGMSSRSDDLESIMNKVDVPV